MRSAEARLIRLEAQRSHRCLTCAGWSAETWEVAFEDRTGNAPRGEPARPEVCPACGRWVPPLQRHVIVFTQRTDGPQ